MRETNAKYNVNGIVYVSFDKPSELNYLGTERYRFNSKKLLHLGSQEATQLKSEEENNS